MRNFYTVPVLGSAELSSGSNKELLSCSVSVARSSTDAFTPWLWSFWAQLPRLSMTSELPESSRLRVSTIVLQMICQSAHTPNKKISNTIENTQIEFHHVPAVCCKRATNLRCLAIFPHRSATQQLWPQGSCSSRKNTDNITVQNVRIVTAVFCLCFWAHRKHILKKHCMDYFSVTKSGRVTGRKMMQTCLPHLPPTPPKILKTFDTPLLSIMLCSSTPPDAIWTLILVFNQFLALGGTTVTDINRTRITVLFFNLRWLLTTQCVTHPQPAITIMPDEIVRWSNLLSSTSESAMKPKTRNASVQMN